MSSEALYSLALCAAFWMAVCGARASLASTADAARFVAGLALGAGLARAGGLLCVPLGLLLAAPWRAPARARFLDMALPALPPAFAVAKLGCLAVGCCTAAGVEALGFALLQAISRLRPKQSAALLALAGIGAVRLAALPLRPEARGSAWLAAGWLTLAALLCPLPRGGFRCPRPGSATSRPAAGSSRPGCAVSSRARASSS